MNEHVSQCRSEICDARENTCNSDCAADDQTCVEKCIMDWYKCEGMIKVQSAHQAVANPFEIEYPRM